ncbi:DUF1648 domain-containing protein [Salicibibacter cibarius]|nr:DUF1648 domain-containing protein [Salicibibacter cibarius]
MLSIIATAYIYPYLPEVFAIHLSITGELGNEVSKSFGAWALLFLIPAGLLFMNAMKLAATYSALNTLYDSEKPGGVLSDRGVVLWRAPGRATLELFEKTRRAVRCQ